MKLFIFGARNHYADTAQAHADERDSIRRELLMAVLQISVVDFVGMVDRLRRLVPHIPGGGGLRVWKESFARQAASQEEARHHFEHLDQSIRQAAARGEPALGAESWATNRGDGTFSFTFNIPGQVRKGAKSAPQTMGRIPSRPGVGGLAVKVAGQDYDLSSANAAVEELEARLRSHHGRD